MGEPTSLLGQARAFARDFPRDQMPQGYLWDVVDYVPSIIDANLTGRGGWTWASDDLGGEVETGILASYTSGDQLLVQTSAGQLKRVSVPGGVVTDRGAIPRGRQNPIQVLDTVVAFDRDGVVVPQLVSPTATTPMDASAPKARVGTVWGEYIVTDGGSAASDTLRFSPPGNPAGVHDPSSFHRTNGDITALGALRSIILVFHASTVERVRGTTAPSDLADIEGDLNLEPLFSRVGCLYPLSLAYWNDSLIFADEHGVHLTDGATVRNLVSQGGISYFWRTAWSAVTGVCGQVFLDYYIVTIRRLTGGALTLICDLNRRQWFRFSNIIANCFIASGGSVGMERLWAGMTGLNKLANISPCFFPTLEGSTAIIDANGPLVMPVFETPWYRLAHEGRKRQRFVYLSYDLRVAPMAQLDDVPAVWRHDLGEEGALVPGPRSPTVEVLDVSYIRSPQMTNYTSLGQLPSTDSYRRYRLPIGQASYGAAFKVAQVNYGSTALRIFDLAVEAKPMERSRV